MSRAAKSVVLYSKKKKFPYIRVALGLALIIFIGFRIIDIAPNLSDKFKMYQEYNAKLSEDLSGMTDLEKMNYYQKIINALNRIIQKNDLNELAHLLLGKAFYLKARLETNPEMGSFLNEKAIGHIRKGFALLKRDRFGEMHYILGELYYQKGEYYYFEALKSYQKAKKMMNDVPPDLEKTIAYIYLAKEQYAVAAKVYARLLKGGRTPELLHYSGVCMYHLDRADLAEQYLNYAIDMYKADMEGEYDLAYLIGSYYYLGRMYFDKKMYDIAENHLKKARMLAPEDRRVLELLLDLYSEIGNRPAASEVKSALKRLGKTG